MERFSHLMNRVPQLLLRSPLHGLMSSRYLLITFTGRKSGKRYTTPVAYLGQGDTIILTTDSLWWKNLRGGAPVGLRVKGQDLTGTAEAVTDEEAIAEALRALVKRVPAYGRFAQVSRGPNGEPNPEEITRAIRNGRVLVRVRLESVTRLEPCSGDNPRRPTVTPHP